MTIIRFVGPRISKPDTPPVNSPPSVTLTSPPQNAVYTLPATVTVSGSGTDSNLSHIEFYRGATLLSTVNPATSGVTYSYNDVNPSANSYVYKIKVYDSEGLSTEATASVSVNEAPPVNNPPSVTLITPVQNAVYTSPASITVSGSATDANLSYIEFYRGTTILSTVTQAVSGTTYSYTDANLTTPGPHVYKIKAYDTGSLTNEATASVSVNAATTGSINIALASNGGVASASSTSASWPAANLNNDNTGDQWATNSPLPQWCAVTFPANTAQPIGQVQYVLAFPPWGPLDFQAQYLAGGVWTTFPNGTRTSWPGGTFDLTVNPAISCFAVRLLITRTPDAFCRVSEIRAITAGAPNPFPPTLSILTPSAASAVVLGTYVTVSASVSGASSVEFYQDTGSGFVLVDSVTSAPYSSSILVATLGTITYKVKAIASTGAFSEATVAVDSVEAGVPFAQRAVGARAAVRFNQASDLGNQNQQINAKPIGYYQSSVPGLSVVTTGGPEDGSGYLRCARPWWSTDTESGGSWRVHYDDGSHTYVYNYGEGVHYVQYRVRMNQYALYDYQWNAPEGPAPFIGFKVTLEGQGLIPGYNPSDAGGCSTSELVLNTGPWFLKGPSWYHGCGVFWSLDSAHGPTQGIVRQTGRTTAPYCVYNSYLSCQEFPVDKWVTITHRVENGPPNAARTRYTYTVFDAWWQDEDTTNYHLHHFDSRTDNTGPATGPGAWWTDGANVNSGMVRSYPDQGSWGQLTCSSYMSANNMGILPRPEGQPDAIWEWSEIIVKDTAIPAPPMGVNFNPAWLQAIKADSTKKNTVQIIPGSVFTSYDLRSSWDTGPAANSVSNHRDEINAYQGAAYDIDNFMLHLPGNGGHRANSNGNQIHTFDAGTDDDTKRWTTTRHSTFVYGGGLPPEENNRAYFPSTPPYDQPPPGNGPTSIHSEYQLWCLRNADETTEIIRACNNAACFMGSDSLPFPPPATDSAVLSRDRKTATWRTQGTWQVIPLGTDLDTDRPYCADYENKYIYSWMGSRLLRLSLQTKQWTLLGTGSGYSSQLTPMCWDRARQLIFVAGAGHAGASYQGFGVWTNVLSGTPTYNYYPATGPGNGVINPGARGAVCHVYKPGVVDYYLYAWSPGTTHSIYKITPDRISGAYYIEPFCTQPIPVHIDGGTNYYNRLAYFPAAGGVMVGPVSATQPVGFIWTDS